MPALPARLRWTPGTDDPAVATVAATIDIANATGTNGFTSSYETRPGATYLDGLREQLTKGTAPDVFWVPASELASLVKANALLDLAPLVAADRFDLTGFYPGPMIVLRTDPTTGKAGDALWGLPSEVSTLAVYLNNTLVAQSGATDPRVLAAQGAWNWTAFKDVATKVAALGGGMSGFAMPALWWGYSSFLNNAGGGLLNGDRSACALGSDASARGLQYLSDLYASGVALPFGEDATTAWMAGTVGMTINGRWTTPDARAHATFDWDVVPLPVVDGGAPQGNWLFWGFYAVNAETAHPKEAWKLVQQLTSVPTEAALAAIGASMPSRTAPEAVAAFLAATPPANNQAFVDATLNRPVVEAPLWSGSWTEYVDVVTGAAANVLTGKRTPAQFTASVCTEAAGALAT